MNEWKILFVPKGKVSIVIKSYYYYCKQNIKIWYWKGKLFAIQVFPLKIFNAKTTFNQFWISKVLSISSINIFNFKRCYSLYIEIFHHLLVDRKCWKSYSFVSLKLKNKFSLNVSGISISPLAISSSKKYLAYTLCINCS